MSGLVRITGRATALCLAVWAACAATGPRAAAGQDRAAQDRAAQDQAGQAQRNDSAISGTISDTASASDPAARETLVAALGLPELLEIMQREGQSFGGEIGADFLPGGGGEAWASIVARIYDADRMRAAVERGLATEIGAEDLPPLIGFFHSPAGQRIVAQEVRARRAFLEPGTEEAARDAWRLRGDEKRARVRLLEAYVDANDLVEFNVAGALTSNLRFYRGLVDGGAYEMSEDEMLADVWGQEEAVRADTHEWLMAYLLMAYAPLSDDDIEAYVALSKTPAGQALNRGLFAGFDAMYADLSYALGLAVAAQMKGEDL